MNKQLRQNLPTTVLAALFACLMLLSPAKADQVIPDDLIVQSSLCVGFDCVNNENFGFDTIRLKENNTRIKFEDTSVGTFPSTDWQLTANDSASGGQNRFSIEDVTAARIPFTVEGGSTSNSIYIDSTGRVGFRTATPVLDLHVNTSNTPGLRLEQNNTGGFTPQTWDIAGNEANFFVRDVTSGSRLPFRIRPGAPTSSLDIAANGDVGIGTASTSGKLHIVAGSPTSADDSNIGFLVQDGSTPTFQLSKTSTTNNTQWNMTINANGDYLFKEAPDALATMRLEKVSGNVVLPIGRIITQGPTCGGAGCDFVFDPAYKLESIEDHANFMWQNSHLAAVGPTQESAPSFDLTEKVGGMLNELEKAHIYIDQLNERLKERESKVSELTERLARLEALLEAPAK